MKKQSIKVGFVLVLATFVLGDQCLGAATAKPAPKAKKSPAATQKTGTISREPYVGAIAVEAATGRVLFQDQADARAYPASTLKLMDLLLILEKIKQGQLKLEDPVPVSAKASKTGGTQVWLAEKESFSVDEMLYALMVQSANDAAVALAEKVGGTAEGFVEMMNARARQLGMNATVFHSVHGLPPGQGQEHSVTSPRDFALLARELVNKHPEALRYTSTRERPFRTQQPDRTVVMRTHNHLLSRIEGCDGLKTGYIRAAGYSIVVTAARNGNRVIVVVMGSATSKVRDAKAAEITSKAFAALAAK